MFTFNIGLLLQKRKEKSDFFFVYKLIWSALRQRYSIFSSWNFYLKKIDRNDLTIEINIFMALSLQSPTEIGVLPA